MSRDALKWIYGSIYLRGVPSRERSMNCAEALLDACKKRVRPIVMTTMAMGAGMLPVALDLGMGDGSFRMPVAIVVIGGLITSPPSSACW